MQTKKLGSSSKSKPKPKSKPKLAFGVIPAYRNYRLRVARYVGVAEAIASYIRERPLAGRGTLRLLDIGPGSGCTLQFCQVAGIDGPLDFYGLDNNPHRLEKIYEPSRWKLTIGDAQAGFPYPSKHFDICVCEQVLEHLTQTTEVVDEMVRVLRPSGLLIIGVPIFLPGIASLRAWGVACLDRLFGLRPSHVQTFTKRSIVAMVCSSDSSLQLVQCRGFRIVSGGLLSWLEDYKWWYRANRWLGRAFPWLCTEVQLVLYKRDAR